MNTREVGSCYEEQAVLYLQEQQMQILCRNYRSYRGEVDIIAREGEEIVFVEVKYRFSDRFGRGEFHVDKRKQHRIYQAAQQYLLLHYPEGNNPFCRFDVIAIDGKEGITHYRDAFRKE